MKGPLLEPFYEIFDRYQPVTIGEIGTHDGRSGLQFCKYCLQFNDYVSYTGYDAFDLVDGDKEFAKKELNGKKSGREWFARKHFERLKNENEKFDYKLIKGFTNETLEDIDFDFVYIDAGHSYDSVKYDYSKVKGSKIIVFDDYNFEGVKLVVDKIINDFKIPVLDWYEAISSFGLRFAQMPVQRNETRVVIFKE